MFFIIYKITNKIDGKEYIGMHKTNNLDDGYMGSGKYIKRAILKYGVENFKKEILFIFDNEEDMHKTEANIVTEQYCNRENTYNICPGGKGGFGYINQNNLSNTDELKQRKSNKMKEYWTEEKRKEKSENLVNYNKIHGTERHVLALSKRYEDQKYLDAFTEKMKEINQSPEKRAAAGKTIKQLWKGEEYKKKTIESRIGIVWWNNGVETIKSRECPGKNWIRGRCNKNLGRKKNETN